MVRANEEEIIVVVAGKESKFDFERLCLSYEKALEASRCPNSSVESKRLAASCAARLKKRTNPLNILEESIQLALENISYSTPWFDSFATRLLDKKIQKEYKEAYYRDYIALGSWSLKEHLKRGITSSVFDPELLTSYNEEDLENIESTYRVSMLDNNLVESMSYVGYKTLYDKYLLRSSEGNIVETPHLMFIGIAMSLAKKELDRYQRFKEFYYALIELKIMVATPILTNARSSRKQLNSCYVGACGDSIESIFTSFKDMAMISKNGGGIGWDFTQIRGTGSSIAGIKKVGGGIIPWLKISNDIAIAVDQLGTRKGAIAAWCEIWHIDIEDFIELRKNSGDERRRAHDLFPALWIPDLFMSKVWNDDDWFLFNPKDVPGLGCFGTKFEETYGRLEHLIDRGELEGITYKRVRAKTLWKKILTQIFETGLPFVAYKDTANRANPNRQKGLVRSSNLCTEIFQNTHPGEEGLRVRFRDNTLYDVPNVDIPRMLGGEANRLSEVYYTEKIQEFNRETAVCTLASINLSKLETYNGIIDSSTFSSVANTVVRMLDNVIDLNYYPVESAKNTQIYYRAIGVGVMGEYDFITLNQKKTYDDSLPAYLDKIYYYLSHEIINASASLAEERGAYPYYQDSDWFNGVLPHRRTELAFMTNRFNLTPMELDDRLRKDKELVEKIKRVGVRNGYMMAIAPTSSISLVANASQSIEPPYAHYWYEENISGLIPSISSVLRKLSGSEEFSQCKSDKEVKELLRKYPTAYEIDPKLLIKLASVRQMYIDQGQSLNLFVDPNISGKELSDLYFMAWERGLKSVYYCRTKSKELDSNSPLACEIGCESCQ